MILAAVMLMLAQADVTLAAVERLPAVAAGDLALAGKDHGPIETVARRAAQGMNPPGLVELEMLEPVVAGARGCERRRWTVSFQPLAPNAEPVKTGAYAATEVALARSGVCPNGGYVHLNPGVEPSQAFVVLEQLDRIALGRSRPKISCFDATASMLCSNDQTTLQSLARLRPWVVTREGKELVAWLGAPGDVVTEVRFDARSSGHIVVNRKIPAPF